ncbi:DUF6266 family protein [Pedobacter chitinilyticus]|uniref:Uncharacterized protein n=1 Tax=Pedobacter chitinilyticus TaxID=2233776 RepID=A0A3S3Q196_9SPHI|nr:DUF6266 family protein [Pedobacter chitinilyticus]RWU10612.1 hypothetical protein DPV69_04540 [Pedobacter chitinilyticus]
MGIIRNGGNGAFSGKAGSFIGSNWKNVSYIKGIPRLSSKPPTDKQKAQRARFALVLAFLSPIKEIVKIGFQAQEKQKASAFNLAIQHALNFAIVCDYPDYSLDLSKVLLAKGSLTAPAGIALTSPAAAKVQIAYSNMANKLTAFDDDRLAVIFYSEENAIFMPYIDVAKRSDGGVLLDVPTEFVGKQIDTFLFFIAQNSTRCSLSLYAGTVAVM